MMRLAEVVSCSTEALMRMVYPAYCGVCSAFLELRERWLCAPCLDKLQRLKRNPEDSLIDSKLQHVDEAWALYPYRSPVREAIFAVKFEKKRQVIRIFQEDLRSFAHLIKTLTTYDALIPIPLDRSKLIEREFNQAELIARFMASVLKTPVQNKILQKHYSTAPQSRLNKEERLANLLGTFEVSTPRKVRDRAFLLVDDIFTTGATAEEAARTLKRQGAKRVDLFALARTALKS